MQYWSKISDCIVSAYCGLLFVGHCSNKSLELFGEDMKWSPPHLLHLGMNGPKVNLAFQRQLFRSLEEKSDKSFLDIDTCPLHNVHNAFHNDVEQFIVDINGFVKLSSAGREDF